MNNKVLKTIDALYEWEKSLIFDICSNQREPIKSSTPIAQAKKFQRTHYGAKKNYKTLKVPSNWRRVRDSNPRYSYPYTSLAGRRFRPLSQLSDFGQEL